MMSAKVLRKLSFHARSLGVSGTPPLPSLSFASFFSSRRDDQPLSHPHTQRDSLIQDITNEELKRRVAKLQEGDAEAIPSVFEAILQRYLTGNPIEADKELMREILGKGTESEDDEEDELDSDWEASDDDEDEDFDVDSKGRSGADK